MSKSNEQKMQPNEVYLRTVADVSPKTKHAKRLIIAFVVGGLICMLGQGIHDIILMIFPTLSNEIVGGITSSLLIFIGALLTGIGVYDYFGGICGAGTIVPITGFANSVVSPAIEFKSEGYTYGTAAKMFTIAGPIIVNGVTLSAIVGLIYYIISLIG